MSPRRSLPAAVVVGAVACSLLLPGTSAYAGDPDWARIEVTPGEYVDSAQLVAVDPRTGSVHVAGNVADADFTSSVLGLVDYTADGTKLADRRYYGPSGAGTLRHEFPAGIAVSPTRATVYVAGRSSTDDSRFFVDTVAWGRTGPPQWSSHYPLPAGGEVWGLGRNEATGDVYTLASYDTDDGSPGSAQLLLAFGADGTPRWERTFRISPLSSTRPMSIAVDRVTGNIYTTGSNFLRGDSSVVTIAYDAQGRLLWSEQLPGQRGVAIAVDPASGHVVVGGYAPDGELLTLAYDPDGQLQWSVTEPSTEGSTFVDLAVDPRTGTVIQTGYDNPEPMGRRNDYVTRAYDLTGQPLWTRIYNGVGDRSDRPGALVLDSRRGVVYVTGTSDRDSYLSSHTDVTTVAYDLAGNLLRVDRYASRYHFNYGEDIAVDPRDGSVHVAGTVYTQAGLNSGALALSYPTAAPAG